MEKLIFYQLFEQESSTYTYLLADPVTRETILIDPVLEAVERDLTLLKELDLQLKYILDTHVHADHITGSGVIRKRTNAKTAISAGAKVSCADLNLHDGQELSFGAFTIKALATPGHTDSCMSFYCEGLIFTGDSLLIRSAGRTDFQQGSSSRLYDSIQQKLFTLPDEALLYPAHDYKGQTHSTIGLEKVHNPRIKPGTSREQFQKTMAELNLTKPKKINEALPANLACGET